MVSRTTTPPGSSTSTGGRRVSGAPKFRKKPGGAIAASTSHDAIVKDMKPAIRKNMALPIAKPPRLTAADATNATAGFSCVRIYRASPLERIGMIRDGIPAVEAKRLFADLAIGQGTGLRFLKFHTATVNKKARHGETLSPEESERLVGFAKLVGQAEAMVQDAGMPGDFDTRAWMVRWLTEPLPALGGTRPADLMDTMEGQALVSAALARIQSGAYA